MEQDKKQKPELEEEQLKEVAGGGVFTHSSLPKSPNPQTL